MKILYVVRDPNSSLPAQAVAQGIVNIDDPDDYVDFAIRTRTWLANDFIVTTAKAVESFNIVAYESAIPIHYIKPGTPPAKE